MEIPTIESPSKDEINKYHSLFVEHLIKFFETHKSKYIKNHEKVFLNMEE